MSDHPDIVAELQRLVATLRWAHSDSVDFADIGAYHEALYLSDLDGLVDRVVDTLPADRTHHVHYAEFIRDQGYYYPEFDCQAGGQALLRAFREHDANLPAYRAQASRLLHALDIANDDNVRIYTEELLRLGQG